MTKRKQPRRWAGLLTLTLALMIYLPCLMSRASAMSRLPIASSSFALAWTSSPSAALGPGGGLPGGGSTGPPLAMIQASSNDRCASYVSKIDSLIDVRKPDEALSALLSADPCQGASLPRKLWIARSRVYLLRQAGRNEIAAHEADSLLRTWGHTLGAEGISLLSAYKGTALFYMGEYSRAVAPLRRAVDHYPRLDATRANLSANLAWALLRTGQHTEAFCRFVETRRVLQTAGQSAHNAEVLREVYKGLSEVTDSAGVLDEAHCTGTRYNENGNQDGGGLALVVLIIALFAGLHVVREAARGK